MKRYRSQEYAMSNSGWILLDTAEQIFKLSRERVYNSKDGWYSYPLQRIPYQPKLSSISNKRFFSFCF